MKPLTHEITPEQLEAYAWEYIQECMNHKKEHPTASGRIVHILDRKIPTIAYFLNIWLPLKKEKTMHRSTYYNWLKRDDPATIDTIGRIEGYLTSLAVDIVANEGKGIFYAKNKLGMSDKENERKEIEPVTGMIIIDSKSNPIEPINIYINEDTD
jgi:hypothetical protein